MGNICYYPNEINQSGIAYQMHQDNLAHRQKIVKEQKKDQGRFDEKKIIQTKDQEFSLPQLPQQVQQTLEKHNFFAKQLQNIQTKHFDYEDGLYIGSVNQSFRPDGYGKIYKKNGEIYLGEWSNGKVQGDGVYILKNGSYFKGKFVDNKANCQQGYYQSPQLKYSGAVKDNIFEGKGTEEGQKYIFQGRFVNGKKSHGKLVWRDQNDFTFFYTGQFNQNQKFHGKGVLVQFNGTYEGEFVNGVKQGNGYYKGVNGIKYRGTYQNGKKEGFGTIYNNDETLAYKGQMKNGLPHGRGEVYINGKAVETELVDGIDKQLLQDMKQHQ